MKIWQCCLAIKWWKHLNGWEWVKHGFYKSPLGHFISELVALCFFIITPTSITVKCIILPLHPQTSLHNCFWTTYPHSLLGFFSFLGKCLCSSSASPNCYGNKIYVPPLHQRSFRWISEIAIMKFYCGRGLPVLMRSWLRDHFPAGDKICKIRMIVRFLWLYIFGSD